MKSDFGVYSWHVCNISWAFYFNRHLINLSRTRTNTHCHLKSDFGVYSRHVCNISWAFYFNRHLISLKSDAQTFVAILSRTLGSIADTFVINISWTFNFNRHLINLKSDLGSIAGAFALQCFFSFQLIDIWSNFRVLSELSPLVWFSRGELRNADQPPHFKNEPEYLIFPRNCWHLHRKNRDFDYI